MAEPAPPPLAAARRSRWWQTGRPVRSMKRAAAFVDDVGFALLFPKHTEEFPSLWATVSDRAAASITDEWSPEMERMWGWKDELPRAGLTWYGRFVRGRPSFLSPALLVDLYPRAGDPGDFVDLDLSPTARRVADFLLINGPSPSALLREVTDAQGTKGQARFTKAMGELGRALVVTHFGTQESGSGWPSAVLELTARAFPVGVRPRRARVSPGHEDARLRAAGRFLDTMLRVRAYELGNAFGWGADAARDALDRLVAQGAAAPDGNAYLPRRAPHP
jgi:hypothetical protein